MPTANVLYKESTSFFVQATHDYLSDDPELLHFSEGDVIEVLTTRETGWWDGLLGEERGWFPSNFVRRIPRTEALGILWPGYYWEDETNASDDEGIEDASETGSIKSEELASSNGLKPDKIVIDQTKQKPLAQKTEPIAIKTSIRPISGPSVVAKVTISKTMPASEVLQHLANHHCPNITNSLDLTQCSASPITGGGFGDIYSGALVDGSNVAIKCVRLFFGPGAENSKSLKHAARELYTWSKFHHENVLELLGVVQFRDRIAMVSPWMDNGTLPNYLARRRSIDRYLLCLQIAKGLTYLHAMGTVHGDIKGFNILISKDGTAKIADFGNTLLKNYTLQFTDTTSSSALSTRWAAPELLEGRTRRSPEADVYALGMTILEVITGLVPYHDKPERAVMYAVGIKRAHPPRPDAIPATTQRGNTLWALLLCCWAYEPEARPKAREVMNAMEEMQVRKYHRNDFGSAFLNEHTFQFTDITSSSGLSMAGRH